MTTSKIYVFTYGSLLNLTSLKRTIGRKLEPSDLILIRLNDHRTVWGYSAPLLFDGEKEPTNGVFLTLIHDIGSKAVGAIFCVSEEEFENLKKREKGYDVFSFEPSSFSCIGFDIKSKIYAFGTRTLHKIDGVIARNYINLITDALANFDAKFQEEYRTKVFDHLPFDVKNGEYTFYDKVQNTYAKGQA